MSGGNVDHLDEYPDYNTQGETLAELIQRISALGAELDRHGVKHDW
jgi:predicted RNase H-like HicB family nuclease